MRGILIIIYVIIPYGLIQSQSLNDETLSLSENVPSGFELDLQNLSGAVQDNFQPVILNVQDPGVSSLRLERKSALNGDRFKLRVTDHIDRELVCPKPLGQAQFFVIETNNFPEHYPSYQAQSNSYVNECSITLKIVANNAGNIHRVNLVIQDVNDNPPVWPNFRDKGVFEIEFKDGDPEGTQKVLPQAFDLDDGLNSFITYRLMPLVNNDGYNIENSRVSEFFQLAKVNPEVRDSFQANSRSLSSDLLVLRAKTMLDRETHPEGWTVALVATDSGISQPLSSSLILHIKLTDVNDNAPQFSQTSYESLPIPENKPPGTTVLKLKAKDLDSGDFGKVRYEIISNNDIIHRYFEINDDGELKIKKKLQIDRVNNIEQPLPIQNLVFKVRATDGAPGTYALSTEATVTLKIEDVNDESPILSIHPVKRPRSHSLTSKFKVNSIEIGLEENKSEQLIALIDVSDPDQESNDAVTCNLMGPNAIHFRLQRRTGSSSQSNEYELRSIKIWDREKNDRVEISLECRDNADHLTKQLIEVVILDLNDNEPTFTKSVFQFRIKENDGEANSYPPNYYAIKPIYPSGNWNWLTATGKAIVTANDLDEPQTDNSKLQYRIERNMFSMETTQATSINEIFEIDRDTGSIYPLGSLDRESQASYKFNVVVNDLGDPKLSATCQVEIDIVDVNDNAPEFLPLNTNDAGYNFIISETNSIGKLVGEVAAIDKDLVDPAYYLSVPYSYQKSSENVIVLDRAEGSNTRNELNFLLDNSADANYFTIDQKNGTIRTRRPIDREERINFSFRVFLTDGAITGEIKRLMNLRQEEYSNKYQRDIINSDPEKRVHLHSTLIVVSVKDENDNAPRFMRPNSSDHLIYLDPEAPIGSKIYSVICYDPDDSLNGKIIYEILTGNDDGLFSIQSHNGNIHLDRPIPESIATKAKLLAENFIRGDDSSTLVKEHGLESYPTYVLKLRACDMSEKPLCNEFPNLQIKIQKDVLNNAQQSGSNSHDYSGRDFWYRRHWHENMLIIVSVISFFVVLLFITVFVISRCRVHYNLNKRSTRQNETPKFVTDGQSPLYLAGGNGGNFIYAQSLTPMTYDSNPVIVPQAQDSFSTMRLTSPMRLKSPEDPETMMMQNYGILTTAPQMIPMNQVNEYQTINGRMILRQQSRQPTIGRSELRQIDLIASAQRNGEHLDSTTETNSYCGSEELCRIARKAGKISNDIEPTINEGAHFEAGKPLPAYLNFPKATFV